MKKPGGRGAKRKSQNQRDPKKDKLIQELSRLLVDAGYVVRREELKRGLGWKATSGSCRAFEQKLIFVDRRLSQDEQISFLQSTLSQLNIEREVSDDAASIEPSDEEVVEEATPAP